MGNRAVVTFAKRCEIEKYLVPSQNGSDGQKLKGFVADNPHRVGVYLHWNGGRDSIEAFLGACKELGYRDGARDSYGVARFTQTVCNFFGRDGLPVGVDTLEHLDTNNGDNGVYVVGDNWEIIGHEFAHGEQSGYDVSYFTKFLVKLTKAVDKAAEEIRKADEEQDKAKDACDGARQ